MVELADEASELKHNLPGRDKTCLRMNVSDVKGWAKRLQSLGVDVNYQEHDWGTVVKFRDPDGNLCAFKDSPKFEAQVADHAKSQG